MGFTLLGFFMELQEILQEDESDAIRLQRLKECIEYNRQYAKECGVLEKL